MSTTGPQNGDGALPNALHDEALYKALLDHMHEGVYVVDNDRRILYWNRAAELITGYREQDVVGRFCQADLLMHCDEAGRGMCGEACPLKAVIKDGTPRESLIYARHRHGHRIPVSVRAQAIRNDSGVIVGAIEVFQQPAAQVRAELRLLEAQGCLDQRTGVQKKQYMSLRAEQRLTELDLFGVPLGWMRIDLDGVEDLQRRYGHAALDAAITLTARTIEANVGPLDLVGRWDHTSFRVSVYNRAPHEMLQLARTLVVLVRA